MYIKKSKISQLIKREREKERLNSKKECNREIKNLKKELESKHAEIVKELKAKHKEIRLMQTKEIRMLRNEIEKNHSKYMELRLREKNLNDLSAEMEAELNKMATRVHESMQPFYRTMSKVETTKRKSDRKHEKVERIFSVVN